MRVLLISHTSQSRTEGQPKAAWLARMPGIELRVLVPDRWKHYGQWRLPEAPTDAAGFAYEVGKVRWPWVGPAQFYLHWYPGLRKVLAEFRPDVIDLWEEPWGLVSAHACWLRSRVIPSARIISETEQNLNKRLPFPFEKFRQYTLQRADYAVARNQEAVGVLRDKGYRGAAEVVSNGVDAELFRPLDRGACRAKLGCDGFVVGYVGRLVEEKGLLDLVEAIGRCPSSVNAIFVGGGPLRERILARAAELGVAARVRVMPARPLQELPEVMNALDVLALPSHTTERWKEQFGRVLIEANACATPVIGSSSGAIPDVVGRGGLVFGERSADELAAAIGRLAGDAGLCRELGEAGREQVLANYTWQRVAERMYAIYQRVLNQGAVGSKAEVTAAPLGSVA